MVKQNIGFVGVGRMGSRMVRRFLQSGYAVTIYDKNDAAVGPLLEEGATRGESPADVGSAAEIVMASLPVPAIVQAVALGSKGVVEGNRVKIFIDLSTTGSTVAKQVADGLAIKHIKAVDSPVSGGLKGAENGTLAVMVSCSEEVFETVRPVLEVIGKVFFVGTHPGQGQTMKLLNNLLSATAMTISSEALVMGVKAGLDPQQFVDIVNAGTGRNSATQDKLSKYVITRTFDVGFAIGLLDKDLRLCMEEAELLGIPMVVGAAVRQLVSITAAEQGPDADMTTTVKTVERWAGVRVGTPQVASNQQ
jgi:3-hydroxyisobutyrate dehydrogenase-like beta-hydroxyacid dehydrogenase